MQCETRKDVIDYINETYLSIVNVQEYFTFMPEITTFVTQTYFTKKIKQKKHEIEICNIHVLEFWMKLWINMKKITRKLLGRDMDQHIVGWNFRWRESNKMMKVVLNWKHGATEGRLMYEIFNRKNTKHYYYGNLDATERTEPYWKIFSNTFHLDIPYWKNKYSTWN